jgi:hypothetical protein
VFSLFDTLILLSRGSSIYFGPANEAVSYFQLNPVGGLKPSGAPDEGSDNRGQTEYSLFSPLPSYPSVNPVEMLLNLSAPVIEIEQSNIDDCMDRAYKERNEASIAIDASALRQIADFAFLSALFRRGFIIFERSFVVLFKSWLLVISSTAVFVFFAVLFPITMVRAYVAIRHI